MYPRLVCHHHALQTPPTRKRVQEIDCKADPAAFLVGGEGMRYELAGPFLECQIVVEDPENCPVGCADDSCQAADVSELGG